MLSPIRQVIISGSGYVFTDPTWMLSGRLEISSHRASGWTCYAGSGPAPPADPAGGGAVHPEAHAQSVGRGAVRALAGEPLIPVLLRRAELLPQPAVRPSSLTLLSLSKGAP